ncbi:MAG: NlpC/P60 family protein [Dehalococcoidales bacterium]|nr:NlpC/P60 family protein [Dehalococcoidales bacterium]
MHIKSIAPILILISSILISCDTTMNFPVSDDVRTSAYEISFKYIGMDYEWGGQDFWYEKNGVVDCSGLVINIYKEACDTFGYSLLFDDTITKVLHDTYTIELAIPLPGDLIFMGDNGEVTHVAIFHRFIGDQIEFLDAYSISGKVGIRQYPIPYEKIVSFGRMLMR